MHSYPVCTEWTYFQDVKELMKNIHQYHVVISDFYLSEMNAFELFKKTNVSTIKIIITKDDDHVFESFNHHVFRYLLKKDLKEKFPALIKDLLVQLRKENQNLYLNSRGEMVNIPKRDIKYIETQKNYLLIHAKETYKIRGSFKQLKNNFIDCDFVVPIYGTMVNKKYIRSLSSSKGYLTMEDQTIIPISKASRKRMLEEKFP